MQTAADIKHCQTELKTKYQAEPGTAEGFLRARVKVNPAHLSCDIIEPAALNPAGMHPMGGGDGTWICPVELMLAGLASCAGVTLGAVAESMKIELKSAEVQAVGEIDFAGTLAIRREAPVGLKKITLQFELTTDAPEASVQKLVELAERYCVVYRTFQTAPELSTQLVLHR